MGTNEDGRTAEKLDVRIALTIEVDMDSWETTYGTREGKERIIKHVTDQAVEPVMEEWGGKVTKVVVARF